MVGGRRHPDQPPVAETLILVQEGSSLIALQVASAVDLPAPGQIRSIAAQAIARLNQ